jgi:hypothetical protein
LTKNDSRRQNLFHQYARNLTYYQSSIQDIFVCPLCGKDYTEEALSANPPDVDIAHIVPKSLGGNAVTMTCRSCNNSVGHRLEGDLAQYIWYRAKLTGLSEEPMKVRADIDTVEIGADLIHRHAGPPELHVIDKISDPKNYSHVQNLVETVPQSVSIEILTRPPYDLFKMRAALVHAAYLLTFRFFGYGYIGCPALERVRQQIHNPTLSILPQYVALALSNVPKEDYNSIEVIREPRDLPCFLAVLHLSRPTDRCFGVIMPSWERVDDEIYNGLDQLLQSMRPEQLRGTSLRYVAGAPHPIYRTENQRLVLNQGW